MRLEKTLKHGNPRGNPQNAPRCGAKTRRGTPCKGPAVRGKKRCRMHGGTNPGRPRDPFVQFLKYNRAVRRYVTKVCMKCELINDDCYKIHLGEELPEIFHQRVAKYCRKVITPL